MNAPNINIKDILAKLSVLKNNLNLLVPIAIAVVALLLVIPTRILSARLRKTVEKNSVAVGTNIDGITRSLAPENLKIVSPKQLEAMAQDANEIERMMDRASRRELLMYGLFPDTNDQSQTQFSDFGERYRQGVTALVQGLNATECPTWPEVQQALASVPMPADQAGNYGRGSMIGVGDRSGGMGTLTLDTLTDAQRNMFEQLCLDRASKARIYVTPLDIAGYTYWPGWVFEDRDKAFQDCWYWQLGYWIVEDVLATVQQMNGSAESVLTAPVKRLMNVSFMLRRSAMVGSRSVYGATARPGVAERPAYVTGPLKGLTTMCTARICSETADIVHFDVQAVVDSSQVVPFMQALCAAKGHRFRGADGAEPEQKYQHNQITILEATVEPVEATAATHLRYRYGNRPVSTVELICEYMFARAPYYQSIKPDQAKKDLGEPVEAAPAAGEQAAEGQAVAP